MVKMFRGINFPLKCFVHINLKLKFSSKLVHTVNDILPLNLAVSNKPDHLTWKRYRLIFATASRLFQETKTDSGVEGLLTGILP